MLLSAMLLGERIGGRRRAAGGGRRAAVAVGFLGVLVVSAPSPDGNWNGYVLLSVAAALFTGSVTVNLRRLAALNSTRTIMLGVPQTLFAKPR